VLNSSGSPQTPDAPVMLTATVSAQAPGSGTPTGEVTFMDGATSIGSQSLSGGTAQLTTTLGGGSHTITAVYDGDANIVTSTSQAVTINVQQAGSRTSLTSAAARAVFGQLVSLTATVTPATGTGTPEGSVTFLNGLTTLATVPLNDGKAVFTLNALALGTMTISASYGGSSGFTGSASASITETVVPVTTVTTVSPSVNPGFLGQFVTISATVRSSSPGATAPSGTVTFKLGKKTLGTGTLSGGTAALKTKKLALGSNKITVVYSGNADFMASTSGTLKEIIKKKPPAKKPKKK
jgi:Big-like domain-containing protein